MRTPTQADTKLTDDQLFIDRETQWLEELVELVAQTKTPRSPKAITPNSKHIATANNVTKYVPESISKHTLMDRPHAKPVEQEGDILVPKAFSSHSNRIRDVIGWTREAYILTRAY